MRGRAAPPDTPPRGRAAPRLGSAAAFPPPSPARQQPPRTCRLRQRRRQGGLPRRRRAALPLARATDSPRRAAAPGGSPPHVRAFNPRTRPPAELGRGSTFLPAAPYLPRAPQTSWAGSGRDVRRDGAGRDGTARCGTGGGTPQSLWQQKGAEEVSPPPAPPGTRRSRQLGRYHCPQRGEEEARRPGRDGLRASPPAAAAVVFTRCRAATGGCRCR